MIVPFKLHVPVVPVIKTSFVVGVLLKDIAVYRENVSMVTSMEDGYNRQMIVLMLTFPLQQYQQIHQTR